MFLPHQTCGKFAYIFGLQLICTVYSLYITYHHILHGTWMELGTQIQKKMLGDELCHPRPGELIYGSLDWFTGKI